MTRFLSLALGAEEPAFSRSIRQLEQASGQPSADIRLTSEIAQALRAKVALLGLDPADTTGPELYSALCERLKRDEATVRQQLGLAADAAPAEIIGRVVQLLTKYNMPKTCFALKASVAKRLLGKKPPKTAMKQLGYRSVASMLKRESAADVYAAALVAESAGWHKHFREQYAKLVPSDFEPRQIALSMPSSSRWQKLAAGYVAGSRHNLLVFPELGTVVLLPMDEAVEALAITTLLLVSEEMNAIRAYSSYAKLQQVKPDFGRRLQLSSQREPFTSARLAGQPVPWRMIQRYYAQFGQAYNAELFEPHVQPEDLSWCNGEDVLVSLDPSLSFWQDTQALGLLDEGQPVSCNMLDVALSCCNHLSFPERIVHFARDSLWHELMMRYLHQGNLETAVRQQLSSELSASEPFALAEQSTYNT